jgi:hypothetical protein
MLRAKAVGSIAAAVFAAPVIRSGAKRILLAAGIIGALGTVGAQADDAKKKIDCGETDLGFTAPGYKVVCTDLSNSTLNVGDSFGAAKTEKLEADSDADTTFLLVIDNRAIGQLFIKRRTLQKDVEGYFSGGTFKEWESGTAVAQFDVNEFVGEADDGAVLDCIGFRHQGAKRYDGIARLVVGIACSGRGRARSYEALKHLEAPSG